MQKRSKRWIAIILTGILSLNLLAGCSAKPVPSQDTGVSNKESKEDASSQTDSTAESGQTDGEQVVRMWTFLDPAAADGRGKALGEIIQNFETEHYKPKFHHVYTIPSFHIMLNFFYFTSSIYTIKSRLRQGVRGDGRGSKPVWETLLITGGEPL